MYKYKLTISACALLAACDQKIPEIADQCGTVIAMSQMTKHVVVNRIDVIDAPSVTGFPDMKPEMHPQWINLGYQFDGQQAEKARCLVFTINGRSGIEAFQLSERHVLATYSSSNMDMAMAERFTNSPNLDWEANGYEHRKGNFVKFNYFGVRH